MSLKLFIFSLTVSLLFASGFGIIDYASGQVNITVPQPRELQLMLVKLMLVKLMLVKLMLVKLMLVRYREMDLLVI